MWSGETGADADMPQIVRHHTVIVAVVSGLVLTVVILAVCATCHQSRHEQRRLNKLSTTATEVPTPTQQCAAVDDHRMHNISASTAQNHQPHGWMGLANGGQCIQRDDGLSAVLTGTRRAPDDRPHAAITELPVDHLAAVTDRTLSRGRQLLSTVTPLAGPAIAAKHGCTSGPSATTNTQISAVATIEKRPSSPSTDGGREVTTPSTRPGVFQYEMFQYPPSLLAQQTAVSTLPSWPRVVQVPGMDASPLSGRRICPGWSSSITPVVAAAEPGGARPGRLPSGTLVHPNCLQTARVPTTSDRQWQRPASVRWTASGRSSRRPETSRPLSATRSTSELYDDVRPRLGATHSIVF